VALTKDHKRIALLYFATITLFFFIGGIFATLIRIELITPTSDLVSAETYNKLFTMHGVIMVSSSLSLPFRRRSAISSCRL